MKLDMGPLLTGNTDVLPFERNIPFASGDVEREDDTGEADNYLFPWDDVCFSSGCSCQRQRMKISPAI